MGTPAPDITLLDQPQLRRYELLVNGNLAALINYRKTAGALDLAHTETLPGFQGRGLGRQIAQYALDDARRQQLKVAPSCSFIAGFIEKNPQYRDLLR